MLTKKIYTFETQPKNLERITVKKKRNDKNNGFYIVYYRNTTC